MFENLKHDINIPFYHSSVVLSTIALQAMVSISFCFWIYRAANNAAILNSEKILPKPATIVTSLFLPIFNLALPCVYTSQIAAASSKRKSYLELVITWWLTWLVYLVSAMVILLPFEQLISEVAGYGLILGGVASNVTLLILTHMITASQHRRAGRARSRS